MIDGVGGSLRNDSETASARALVNIADSCESIVFLRNFKKRQKLGAELVSEEGSSQRVMVDRNELSR